MFDASVALVCILTHIIPQTKQTTHTQFPPASSAFFAFGGSRSAAALPSADGNPPPPPLLPAEASLSSMGEAGVEFDPEEDMPPLVALDAELPALEASG